MANQAHLGSIDDLARFRAQLLNFVASARVTVEECALEVSRQQAWLEMDRRKHWEGEAWRRQKRLEEAKQSLFRESLSPQAGPSSWHQMQVHHAERSLEEARQKLERIKGWSRTFEQRTLPMVKQVEQLHSVLSADMPRAVNFLTQSLAALDAYASRMPAPARPETEAGAGIGVDTDSNGDGDAAPSRDTTDGPAPGLIEPTSPTP
jgi:hypothetical protein